MTPRAVRRAAVAAGVLAVLVGCSFRGSVVDGPVVTAAGPPASGAPAATAAPVGPSPAAPASPAGAGGTSARSTARTAGPAASTAAALSSDPASASAVVDRCHTGGLSAGLNPGPSGAGQRSATVVLRNTGSRTCTVTGYGGIGLEDAGGRPLPTHQLRVAPPAPGPVTLTPGASATSRLRWSAVPGAGDAPTGSCQPVPATLQVIPPDETAALPVPWGGGPVCEAGTVEQQPYGAG